MSDVLALITQPTAGGLSPAELETIGAARDLASQTGGALAVALIGDGLADAATEAKASATAAPAKK